MFNNNNKLIIKLVDKKNPKLEIRRSTVKMDAKGRFNIKALVSEIF